MAARTQPQRAHRRTMNNDGIKNKTKVSTMDYYGVSPPDNGGASKHTDAEDAVVRALEDRRRRASLNSTSDWQASEMGEQPLLSRVTFQEEEVFHTASKTPKTESSEGQRRFMGLVKRVGELKAQGRLGVTTVSELETTAAASVPATEEEEDEEVLPEVSGIFDDVGGQEIEIGESEFAHADTDANRLMQVALVLDQNFMQDDGGESVLSGDSSVPDSLNGYAEENLPLVGGKSSKVRRQAAGKWYRFKRNCRRYWRRAKRRLALRQGLIQALHPVTLLKETGNFLVFSWFTKVGVPCLICAHVLFYYMGNPSLPFLDLATVSWWFVFAARQTLTLQLAILTQFILIDLLALRNRLTVRVLGPLFTLFAINSKGWPFIFSAWALWDMFLLHGDHPNERNWLYSTNLELFSDANKGGDLINDPLYTRVLFAMLVCGVATAIKRLTLAMYFGKKTVANYKSRLESILADIVIITEVAELALEARNITGMVNKEKASLNEALAKKKRQGAMQATKKWGSVSKFDKKSKSSVRRDSSSLDLEMKSSSFPVDDESLTDDDGKDDSSSESSDSDSDSDSDEGNVEASTRFRHDSAKSSVTMGTSKMKHLLDRWEEPTDKNDKSMADASISDALKFRKALSFMDGQHPFSSAFGLASTRDQCIKSAQKTYRKLMILQPGSEVLSFDTLALLAFDAEGAEDESKYRAIKRLFRPGLFNEVSLVAFVQGCDSVYRRLRYFRASVGNASVIDRVLEQMFEGVFYFLLALVILGILEINPWSLLVSMSTLLVTFAFAFGPSASKYIEGILLIAARRPYDLGDRIILAGADSVTNPGVSNSWFVEDINLFYTTLRFAATNELSTVNNASIASSRIINCNRSSNAFVNLNLQFLETTTPQQLDMFRQKLDKFVEARPRIWEQIVFFRCDNIDNNIALMEYSLRLRHRKSWQDAGTILENQSELLKFCDDLSGKLDMTYYFYQHPRRVINLYETDRERSMRLDACPTRADLIKSYDESFKRLRDAPPQGDKDQQSKDVRLQEPAAADK